MFHMKMGSVGLLLLEGLSSRLSSEGDKFLQKEYLYDTFLENHRQNGSRVKENINWGAINVAGIAIDAPVHDHNGLSKID